MSPLLRFLALAFCLSFASGAAAIDPMPFTDRAEEVRFQDLLHELRCLQCQNQTLADSDADIARQLREEVFRLMRDNKTDDEIKDFLIDRYGPFVLYKPRVQSSTWLLWFGPFVILVGASAFLWQQMRRRRRTPVVGAAPTPTAEEDW